MYCMKSKMDCSQRQGLKKQTNCGLKRVHINSWKEQSKNRNRYGHKYHDLDTSTSREMVGE